MKKINWLDHFANLLVVILGISIAFYLENYKEDKANRNREKQYIQSLIVDLEIDIETLDTLRSLNKMITQAIVDLSKATDGEGYDDGEKVRNDVLIIQYNPPFESQRSVYETIKSSGQIDAISDFELRNSIIELYEQYYRGTNQYDAVLNEHVRDFIKPFFIRNMKFTSSSTMSDDFLKSTEFQNMIFAYRYLFIAKDTFYGDVQDKIEEVIDKLQAHLEEL